MFKTTSPTGFHITFGNGWTVSVQYGPGNYCDHYHRSVYETHKPQPSTTAEVAAWHYDGDWLGEDFQRVNGGSHVFAYQTAKQVADIMSKVAAL